MKISNENNQGKNCNGCEYVKCIAINRTMYYCNHEERIDDMGKLGVDYLPETRPNWCPKKGGIL